MRVIATDGQVVTSPPKFGFILYLLFWGAKLTIRYESDMLYPINGIMEEEGERNGDRTTTTATQSSFMHLSWRSLIGTKPNL